MANDLMTLICSIGFDPILLTLCLNASNVRTPVHFQTEIEFDIYPRNVNELSSMSNTKCFSMNTRQAFGQRLLLFLYLCIVSFVGADRAPSSFRGRNDDYAAFTAKLNILVCVLILLWIYCNHNIFFTNMMFFSFY